MRRRPKSQDCARSLGDRSPLPAGRRSKPVAGLILKPRGCGPPLARSQRILTGVCNCFYCFFIVVIRYETKTAARRALTFIVRIFVNDTIAITVWTSFYFHACSCSHWYGLTELSTSAVRPHAAGAAASAGALVCDSEFDRGDLLLEITDHELRVRAQVEIEGDMENHVLECRRVGPRDSGERPPEMAGEVRLGDGGAP